MKRVISIIVIIMLVFIIHILNRDKKTYYFNVMDNNYSYSKYIENNISNLEEYISYVDNDLRITDLIRNINDNIKINNKHIQNILVKADLITISMGNNEIEYKIKSTRISDLYSYIDEVIADLEKLIKLIRIYSKEKIYLIGFYIDNEYYVELLKYLDVKLEDICKKYNITYIPRKSVMDNETNVNISKKIVKSYCK